MVTIVGPTLPDPYYEAVEEIWDDIAAEFGENGISNPIPHITLYGIEGADVETVEARLRTVAADHDPLTVRTDGIGVFPGNHIYNPVALSADLAALHRDVVDAVEDLGTAPMPYYEPGSWFPHIGLALNLPDDRTADVTDFLLDYDLTWELTLDNIEIEHRGATEGTFERTASIDL